MNQIYYTQCPIGYGLGASNGFQIKRLSPGFTLAGDFRHLGMRAFLAGTRTLGPPALRYRRTADGTAEVAWLTPRSHEYETERGLWGRPGGHFAHGVQVDRAVLAEIAYWPAGLFDQPLWIRSDPEPTRGRHPAPLALTGAALRSPPTFEAVTSLAAGADADGLARLLTAVAQVTREGRTLFLIDEPARLADRIALLTFAWPPSWREALTFSTYHDRPEELPGFRIQGTIPAARPNRAALVSQGIVADLGALTWEPGVEPARWAMTLAGWLIRHGSTDRDAWQATAERAARAWSRVPQESVWSSDSLDRLYGFDALVRSVDGANADPTFWSELSQTTAWAAPLGLADELQRARPPEWWERNRSTVNDARAALFTHIGHHDAWQSDGAPAGWGRAVAAWAEGLDPAGRTELFQKSLAAAPESARAGFVRGLLSALPSADSAAALDWLKSQENLDPALLLPLEVPAAIRDTLEGNDVRRLRTVLTQAASRPELLVAALESAAAEASDRLEVISRLSSVFARVVEAADPDVRAAFVRWPLRQGAGAAESWLKPFLQRMFADPLNLDAWRAAAGQVPDSLRKTLAAVVLTVARERTVADLAFRWGVEGLLLPLPEADRPHHPTWPGIYLDRTPSGLDLLKRLFTKEYRKLGVKRWIDQARAQGEISAEQCDRIDGCEEYARALRSGDARALLNVRLPAVPAEDRGALLGQILGHIGRDSEDAINVALDTCREAWPGAFSAGAVGLSGLAQALVPPLLSARADPQLWLRRLVRILERLGLEPSGSGAFAPGGLAGEIVAETLRREGPAFDPWWMRQLLLQNGDAWRCLAADVREELREHHVPERIEAFDQWDRRLTKGLYTSRFFELWLNVCDGATLAAIVAARAMDLRTLGVLSWWGHREQVDVRDDLRDAFAWLAPMAPIAEAALPGIQNWLRPTHRPGQRPAASDDFAPLHEEPAPRNPRASRDVSPLSPRGLARWQCLEALSTFHRVGLGTQACWQCINSWNRVLPLGELETSDRYRFVAWLILRLDESEPFQIARFAKWLVDAGVTDPSRISGWAEELEGIATVPHATRLARAPMVSELRIEQKNVLRDLGARPTRG